MGTLYHFQLKEVSQVNCWRSTFVHIFFNLGFIEFRYNLGSGAVILRSFQKINLGQPARVIAKQYLKEGLLIVNDQDVSGTAEGDFKSLDLAEKLSLGFVLTNYSKVFENIGTTKGFIGCVKSLKINRKPIDLTFGEGVKLIAISDCKDMPCTNHSCLNNGACVPAEPGLNNFTCVCKNGYIGKHCHIKHEGCSKFNPCIKETVCVDLKAGDFSCACGQSSPNQLCSKSKHY